jgi:hypothetical protein
MAKGKKPPRERSERPERARDYYLVAYNRLLKTSMDFYLRPEDGVLLVDEPDRDMPFLVEPEAVLALLTYLEERKEVIVAAQKEVLQIAIDIQELFPGTDVSPRFELLPVPDDTDE